jgi:hypothetical protein
MFYRSLIAKWLTGGRSVDQPPIWRRGGGIRTHGLFVPNEARYQAAPHPEGLAESNGAARVVIGWQVLPSLNRGKRQQSGLGGAGKANRGIRGGAEASGHM